MTTNVPFIIASRLAGFLLVQMMDPILSVDDMVERSGRRQDPRKGGRVNNIKLKK